MKTIIFIIVVGLGLRLFIAAVEQNNWPGFYLSMLQVVAVAGASYFLLLPSKPYGPQDQITKLPDTCTSPDVTVIH